MTNNLIKKCRKCKAKLKLTTPTANEIKEGKGIMVKCCKCEDIAKWNYCWVCRKVFFEDLCTICHQQAKPPPPKPIQTHLIAQVCVQKTTTFQQNQCQQHPPIQSTPIDPPPPYSDIHKFLYSQNTPSAPNLIDLEDSNSFDPNF